MINWSSAQLAVFKSTAKYNLIQKGGRLGFTRWGMEQNCLKMATTHARFLWGDTIQTNLNRYLDMYFLPFQRKYFGTPTHKWHYNRSEHIVTCDHSGGQSVMHMRSAERPDKWEGFEYEEIFLNEAGIILQKDRGKYIWEQACAKMMMSVPNSKIYIGGVPKDLCTFTDLIAKAKAEVAAGNPKWAHFLFTTYDNPFIPREQIEETISVLGEMSRQEVFGEILAEEDGDAMAIVPMRLLKMAWERYATKTNDRGEIVAVGYDPAEGGGDEAVAAFRYSNGLIDLKRWKRREQLASPDLRFFAFDAELKARCIDTGQDAKAVQVVVDAIGSDTYETFKKHYPNCIKFKGSARSLKRNRTKQYGFRLKIAEVYWKVREEMELGKIALNPADRSGMAFSIRRFQVVPHETREAIAIEAKEQFKKRYGKSPNDEDAIAMSYSTEFNPWG